MAQKLKFGNGTWATKKGSTLSYNDEGGNYKPLPFTTTRDSIATRVNKEGLIEVVGNDVPRIDYTDSEDGVLLLENSSTNRFLYSEDLTQFDLSSSGTGSSNPIVTSNYGISPDGTQNADRVQLDAGTDAAGNSRITETFTIYATTETISVYLKSNDGQEHTIDIIQSNNAQDIATVTNEWQRFSFTNVNGSPDKYGIGLSGSNGETADVLAWGFQLEQSSFSTSYIPTNGSSVTRQADTASGAGNDVVFNDSEGALFADILIPENISANANICISKGINGQNLFKILYLQNEEKFRAELRDSTVHTIIDYSNFNLGEFSKVLLSYNSTTLKMYIDGFEIGSKDVNGIPSGLNQIDFDRGDGNAPFYGKTKEIGYYDTALTDEELEYMTSYRSLNELVTELNLNEL